MQLNFRSFLFKLECYTSSMKQAIEIGYENHSQVLSIRVVECLEYGESIVLAAEVLCNTWR